MIDEVRSPTISAPSSMGRMRYPVDGLLVHAKPEYTLEKLTAHPEGIIHDQGDTFLMRDLG